jgi:hypothetical protein
MEPHSANEFTEKARMIITVIDRKSDFIKAPPFPLAYPRKRSQRNFLSAGMAYPVNAYFLNFVSSHKNSVQYIYFGR